MALILAVLLAMGGVSVDASLTVNETNPTAGRSVTFTAIYPQDAAKQSRQPQYPNKPTVQVNCSAPDATSVFAGWTSIADKTKVTGGWSGQTYPLILDFQGAANCNAALYSFDVNNQLHVWADTQFVVAA